MSLRSSGLRLLNLVLLGAFPNWPHSAEWGDGPTSLIGVVLILALLERI